MVIENSISLREVLKMDFMQKCTILSGEKGLDNNVTNVNIMVDLDIIKWIKEGEFLLTTAYVFKYANKDDLKKLIMEFSEKKLAGLLIKVKPYIEKMDDEIIDLANELDFPIISLDYEVPFNDIMTPIFKHLFDKQSLLLQKVENVHSDLMDIILNGNGVNKLINKLSQVIDNPIVIKDHQFEEIICSDNIDDACKEKLIGKTLESFNSINNKYREVKKHSDKIMIDDEYIDRTFVPIFAKDSIYGHLVVYGFNKRLTNFDVLSLESASTILSMEFLKRLSVQEVENKYKAEFFDDLISLDINRREKAIDRANYYKFNKESNFNIMTLKFEDLGLEGIDFQEANQRIVKLSYMIELLLSNENLTYMIASKDRSIYIMSMWDNMKKFKASIIKLSEKIQKIISEQNEEAPFIIGVGRLFKGIESTYLSLRDAEKAVEVSNVFEGQKIINFDDLGIYKIFCQDNLKSELKSFFESTLKPLVDYDRKRDTDLVKTLEVYFDTNGNLKKMSEVLFTHYNTILYRITRIKEITKKDLESEHDRFGLQTALKIMKILEL